MCQLTLLDRLVLGLNCSVSQNDDEIHIKQLHADELNILTQRMSRTGFFIQSLALRQNANNDAEYNIVLTFSSENEAGTRRTQCPHSLFRSKLDSHDRDSICHSLSVCDQNAWKKVKRHNRPRRISCLASRHSLFSHSSHINVHKRSTISSRVSSVKDDEHNNVTSEESSTIHISNSSNINPSNSNHGASKREASIYIIGTVQNLPFRRHSPRKVIRKVYTGSLTIPKILNRKRIPAVPTNSLGGPGVSMAVTSTNSLMSTLATNSIVSAVSCSTSSSSVGLNSCAATLLFHDAQSVPIYSAATQLRRLQATATSLSVVQNPESTIEQSKINVPPLAVVPSVITDPQTVTKVNMQDSDITATLHDTLNQPEGSTSVEIINHGNMPSDYLPRSVTVEHLTFENHCELNVSKANLTSANCPITKTPEIEVDVKDFVSEVCFI
ncbi:unnamed protein product [Schistosoma curassoni]|uniref:Ras-associating domain-containing protein n=1 Tax=Schistosoma curassoni TaxID=6186 RepID=A0A183L6J2_9TREM|nr:unnamed protein product [Schistosoma curassoni]